MIVGGRKIVRRNAAGHNVQIILKVRNHAHFDQTNPAVRLRYERIET